MKRQEIFNKAYLGLKAQGKPAKSKYGACYYSDNEGNKCAIGHLIADDTAKSWEKCGYSDTSITSMVQHQQNGVEPWMNENIVFLSALQRRHDTIGNWDNPKTGFEAKFVTFAKEWNLEIPDMEKTL